MTSNKRVLTFLFAWKRGFRMRLLGLLFLVLDLMAADMDPLLLKAQAIVFPKIMLLDQNVTEKSDNKELVLEIVYADDEKSDAERLKSMIDVEYRNKIGDFALEVRLVDIDKFSTNETASAYYIFDASTQKIKAVISQAMRKSRICFGYSYKDFSNNILISLFVKEKTYIYLSKSALHDYHIKFIPIFYKISKVI